MLMAYHWLTGTRSTTEDSSSLLKEYPVCFSSATLFQTSPGMFEPHSKIATEPLVGSYALLCLGATFPGRAAQDNNRLHTSSADLVS